MANKDLKEHIRNQLEGVFGSLKGDWSWDGGRRSWRYRLDQDSPVSLMVSLTKGLRKGGMEFSNGLSFYNDRAVEKLIDPILSTVRPPTEFLVYLPDRGTFQANVGKHPLEPVFGRGRRELIPVWGMGLFSGFVELLLPSPKGESYLPLARLDLSGKILIHGPLDRL